MRKLRERITPARWRRIHFGVLGTGLCMVLLFLGLGVYWGGTLALAGGVLLLDGAGHMLFFRCPKCGSSRLELWSGHCPACGETVDFRRGHGAAPK